MKSWLKSCGCLIILAVFVTSGVASAITPQEISCWQQGSAGGTCFYDPSTECGTDPGAEAEPTPSSPDIKIDGPFLPKAKPSDKVKVQDAYKGKASTYGNDPATGYVDPGDVDSKGKPLKPALAGGKNSQPAIAVYNSGTLGGWWKVIAPNDKSAILQQTDIGPSTSRITDINSVAAKNVFGYKQGDKFPTDQGEWKIEYMGKTKPAGAITDPSGQPTSSSTASSSSSAKVVASAPSGCCPGDGSSGSPTGSGISDEDLPGKTNEEKIWNYLRSLGLNENETAGIVGNIGREGVYDPQNIEDPAGRTKDWNELLALTADDQGYGLIGFTPGRALAKEVPGWADWSKISKVDVNKDNFYLISTQLDVVYGYMKYSSGSGGSMLKEYEAAAKSPGAAALSFEDLVENPRVLASDERVKFAEDAKKKYGGNAVGEASGSSTSATACCPAGGSTATDGTDSAGNEYSYLVDKGLKDYVAAAITGNNIWESGGDQEKLTLNPKSVNSIGATGIAQWYSGRATALHDFASKHNKPWDDLGLQLDYLWQELSGLYKPALEATKAQPDIAGATTTFEQEFEVSGDTGSYPIRIALAKKVLHEFGGSSSASTGSTSSASCSTSDISAYKSPYRDLKQKSPLRIDMGLDYAGKGPIYAIGKATVNVVYKRNGGSGWPGWGADGAGGWVSYTLEDGPAEGKTVYFAENCTPVVKKGDKVTADTKICDLDGLTTAWSESGWAADKTTSSAAAHVEWAGHDSTAYYTAYGENFSQLIEKLGEKPGTKQPGAQKIGTIPKNWPTW